MPIIGITDGSPSFKEIARIRKGAPKQPGTIKDLNYFRFDVRPGNERAAQVFANVFGEQPKSFTGRLAFDQINLNWDANFEVHNTRGLLGRANGEKWLFLRDNQSSRVIVKDGLVIEPNPGLICYPDPTTGELIAPFDRLTPVYSYKNNKGQDVAVYARPVGKLKLVIPQLVPVTGLSFCVVMTHSLYDCIFLSRELAAIELYAKALNMPLSKLTLSVSRRDETIPAVIDNKPTQITKNLVHVELSSEFAIALETAWTGSGLRLVSGLSPDAPLSLPAMTSEQAAAIEADEIEEEPEPEPAPTPTPTPEPAPTPAAAPEPTPAPDPAQTYKSAIEMLIGELIVPDVNHAAWLLNLCPLRKPIMAPQYQQLLQWARLFNAWVDIGSEPKLAASKAANGELPK